VGLVGIPQRLLHPSHIYAISFGLLVFGGVVLMFSWRSRERVKKAQKEAEELIATSAHALWDQARKSSGEQADRLFEQAYAEFRRLENLNPRHSVGLYVWALALIDDSGRKPLQEAERLLLEAQTKLSAALEATPGAAHLIVTQAIAQLWQAGLKPKEEALPLLAGGRELVEKVLAVKPDDAFALSTWAHLLSNQATAGAGGEIDATLVEACECIEVAAKVANRYQLLDGWGVLLLARASRASVDQAVGYLRAAKEKFAEKLKHDPEYHTYNMAVTCARLGEIHECRQWLEGHVPSRRVREKMASDPDFENVRGCEWFRKMVEADGDPGRPSSGLAE
jgi:tetratricopeptide (TPR) repeat protein